MTPRIVSVAGVPLWDTDGHCVWHVWCLVILTVLDCAWDSWHVRSGLAMMLPICLRDIAAFDTVAGVAHGDIDAAFLWLAWHLLALTLLAFVWKAWHVRTGLAVGMRFRLSDAAVFYPCLA